jgi:RHS repeat-associated protein
MRLLKQLLPIFHNIVAAAYIIAATMPSAASAQTAEGYLGWQSPHTSQYFSSPDAACRSQWQYYQAGQIDSRYIGYHLDVGNPNRGGCEWTTVQYLCLDEKTRPGIAYCGTIQPTWIELECASGYVPKMGQTCEKDSDLTPERPCFFCEQQRLNNNSATNPFVGDPIVLSTGSTVRRERDYESADGDFVIGRSYRSKPVGRSASFQSLPVGLAGGWQFDFMYELQLAAFSGSPATPNAKLALVAPDGTAYDFVMQSGGVWAVNTSTGASYAPTNLKIEYLGTLPSDLSTLQSASTQWRLTDGDDTLWTFQTFTRPNTSSPYAVGRPISRVTRQGYQWDFAYRTDNSLQRITDSFGRQATFNWSQFYVSSLASPPAGSLPYPEAISSVALPDGTSIRYTYDPPASLAAPSTSKIQRLVKVERLDTASTIVDSTTFSYGDSRFPQHLTAITDFNGDQIASYAYDSRGRGTSSAHADGVDSYTIVDTEPSGELVRSVTNSLGKIAHYHFAKTGTGNPQFRLTSIVGEASANTAASTTSITYGADNFIATETDEEGRTTSYTRDTRGRPTTIVEAQGTPQERTTTITWNPSFNVPDRIARPGLQTDYTYTPSGQLQTVTETDTTTQTVPYSTAGQTRTWTYTWGTGGRLASINGPKPVDAQGKDDTVSFAYDASGNLLSSTNGLGQITTFATYDTNGRPRTMTDANNVVTAFTYDALGRPKTMTIKHPTDASLDATTSFDYDAHGRVTGITLPETDKLIIDYNKAGQVIAIRAPSGERVDYQVDPDGNITSEIAKRSDGTIARQIKRTFDELGRTLTEAQVPPNTTHWSYDKAGNPTQITAPNGGATTQAFDALNRVVSTVARDGGTFARTYDASDNLTSYTDGISVTTQFVRDGFGDVVQETSPDRGTSTYYYNEAGELTASIDGRGQRIDHTRDVLGRVTQTVPAGRPASESISYTWDTPGFIGSYGVGRLSSVSDGTGTTSFAYDHRGNLIDKRQMIGSGTADLVYGYDLADRVTQISYPSGRIVQYTYDSKGRVSQVQTKALASDPNWTVLASGMTYEPFGSVKAMALGNGLSVANDWGNEGQLVSRRLFTTTSGANVSWLGYSYDGDGNIGAIRDLVDDSSSVYFGYDANDRLALTSRVLDSPPSAETYAYNTGTNRLASLTDASGMRSISYDNRGNTIGETRPGGMRVSTSYDGYGRLLTYNRSGDPAQTNAYNGLDERVSVTSGSLAHSFVYDPDGRLIGEYDSTGAPIAETIWLSPSVANDNQPLGGDDGIGGYAPLAMITGSGASATTYWVHGNHMGVPMVITDAGGTVATPPAYTMAGFPGQTKTLNDLYYNRYRDYDSSLGRYIQSDPIGLEGGDNPFVYANDNPLRWTDPEGLQSGSLTLPIKGGEAILRRLCPECAGALAMAPYVYKGGEVIGGWMGDGYLGAVALFRSYQGGASGSAGRGNFRSNCPDDNNGGECDKEFDDNMDTCAKLYGSANGRPRFPYEFGQCAEEAHRVYSDCLTGRRHTRPFNPLLAVRGRAPF